MLVNQIYNEDCLEGLKGLPDGCIDTIICDLPSRAVNRCKNNRWDNRIDLSELWKQWKRVLVKGGNVILFASGAYLGELISSNPKWFRYELIWAKNNGTDFFHAHTKPINKHESICVFGDKNPHYYDSGIERVEAKRIECRNGVTFAHVRKTERQPRRGFPTSILNIPKERTQVVATQKPLELIRMLVRMYTKPDGVVLDNCMGSGTTAVACIIEKRNYIGYELNKDHYNRAVARIKEYEK